MIEIVNRQRKIALEAEDFLSFAEKAGKTIPESQEKDFTVAFVSDRKMKELNYEFRGKNSTTDVLSFPFEKDEFDFSENVGEFLGDIVISVEQAKKQAVENNLTLEKEIKQLILHGILHLCGFDHETDDGEMNAFELELRDKLQINGE